MARRWSGLLSLLALLGVGPDLRAAGCGDLNDDGRVTVADALVLLQATTGLPGNYCGGAGATACGDITKDGRLDIGDVVVLLNVLVGNPTLYQPCTDVGRHVACPGAPGDGPNGEHWHGRATISGNVTDNQVWDGGCRYDIDGIVFVRSGVTVTIEPGAVVAGVNPPITGATSFSALVFLAGSKINAAGTPEKPILMQSTDHLDHGAGHVGDWGGLTINGRAPVNCPGGSCLAEGLAGVAFGGSDPNDSSGVLRYLRVEFAGKLVDPGGNTLHNLTLNGVGGGTEYDHVQANVGYDDCQAFYGGTVNGRYLVSSACGDDLFDTQLGTRSNVQYALGVYYQPMMQNAGNEGLEWDDNENGFDLLPRTAPTYCNVTLVGTALQPDAGLAATERTMTLRRGTAGIVANAIAEHFRITGLELRDAATAANACDGPAALHIATSDRPPLLVEHSLFFDTGFAGSGTTPGLGTQVHGNTTTPCTAAEYWSLLANGSSLEPVDPTTIGSDPGLRVKYGTGAGDQLTDLGQFIPANTPVVHSLAMDCKTIDPFFETTDFIGAFDPLRPSWLTAPWISFELQ